MILTVLGALAVMAFIGDPFKGLIVSQAVLSVQLPWTILAANALTANPLVMGSHVNSRGERIALGLVALVVAGLNLALLKDLLWPVAG